MNKLRALPQEEIRENRRARRARKAALRRERKKQHRARLLSPICSAFLALTGTTADVLADGSSTAQSEARLRYMYYTEHQSDGTERMTIKAPMAYLRQRVNEDMTVEGNFTYDGISGASPYYLDSVSGASGIGIKDTRYEGQLRVAQKFEDDVYGGTFYMSDEDDYKSLAGTIDFTHTVAGGNTQYSAAISYGGDQVSSELYPLQGGHRVATSGSIGVMQVLNQESMVSSSLQYTYAHGYLTDPYKSYDNRPDVRNEFVWMNRYVYYIAGYDSSLHGDLRFGSDDWGITSQTLELSYYQPIFENWLLRPGIRYYSQHAATFFKDVFPPALDQTGYYSADQRLGTFGSLTSGIKLQGDFGNDWSIDFGINWMEQRTEWSLQGGSGSNFQALHAVFYGVGALKRF